MATWPSALPTFTVDSYGIDPQSQVARTDMDQGPARTRRRFTSAPTHYSVRWVMTKDEFAIFEAWYEYEVAAGAGSFTASLWNGQGFKSVECTFTEPWKATPVGPINFAVTGTLEVRDRPIYSKFDYLNALGLPSLEFDFAGTGTVNQVIGNPVQPTAAITFTRNSVATYFGTDGLLKTAQSNVPRIDYDPVSLECRGLLIEEQRTNLLTYSEQFDTADWGKDNATVTPNAIASPDGTSTAAKVTESAATTGYCGVQQNYSFVSGTTYTVSVHFKAGANAHAVIILPSVAFGSYKAITFSLVDGSVGSTNGAPTYKIEKLANGWWRASVTATATASADSTVFLRQTSVADMSPIGSYALSGSGYIYIWGAQLEAGAFPTSYIPSTTTFTSRASTATYHNSSGVLQTAAVNEARYGYGYVNGQWISQGLIIEPAATNLLTYSEALWDTANWAVGTGLSSFYSVTQSTSVADVYGGNSPVAKFVASATTSVLFLRKTGLTLNSGATYSPSIAVYVPSQAGITSWTISADYQDVETSNGVTYSEFDKWIFVKVPSSTLAAARTVIDFNIKTNGATPSSGFTFYATAAQLEAGSVATSYIKTTSAATTRAADVSSSVATTRVADLAVISGDAFTSFYNQSEGTVVAELVISGADTSAFKNINLFSDGTINNRIGITYYDGGRLYGVDVVSGATEASAGFSSAVVGTKRVAAMAHKLNDVVVAIDGAILNSDTQAALPVVNRLAIGSGYTNSSANTMNGYISRFRYYPKRLDNAKLQELTSA